MGPEGPFFSFWPLRIKVLYLDCGLCKLLCNHQYKPIMKKTFPAIFTCVILFFTQLHLQTQPELRIDSLLKALGQIEHDTAKIDLYLDLHKAYISPDTSKSLEYLSQAIDLSQLITDNGRLAKSYLNLSNYRWKKGQLGKANLALKNVEDLLPVLNNARIEATYHMEKGLVRYLEGSYNQPWIIS